MFYIRNKMPRKESLHSQLMTMTCLKSVLKAKVSSAIGILTGGAQSYKSFEQCDVLNIGNQFLP